MGRPVNSLKSFYAAVKSQPSVVSTRLDPQLRDIREGLRHLDIGLTEAQLDRLIATMKLDQHGGVSFDCFSRWLRVHSSDAGIIEAANVANMPGARRSPAANALSSLSEAKVRPSSAQLDAIAQMHVQERGGTHPAKSTQSKRQGLAAGSCGTNRSG